MLEGTLATLLGAACLLSASAGAGAQEATVQERLQVESRAGRVLVHVTVDNQSSATIYVPKAVAGEKELSAPLFGIRNSSNGEPIQYIGAMVKRDALTEADYLAVKPHTKHSNTLDITDSYAFGQGQHTYELMYVGQYLGDIRKLGEPTSLEHAPGFFSHTGK